MFKSLDRLSLLLVLTFISSLVLAQPQQRGNRPAAQNTQGYGIISGILVDKSTAERIEYGNVILFSVKDSAMVTGTITDNKGRFTLSSLNPGKYYIKLQFIGYESKMVKDLMISPSSADIKLGEIALVPKSSAIQGVEITAEKSLITSNLDKKVITVDKNMSLGGGTATDVMENVPSVTVDSEGNISLRGNSNITLLIDGKPSSQSGLSSSDVLNQIPASSIENVEVITNPSVRYDPDGTSGIINIVLKKKTLQGFNGMISGNVGNGEKYNGSLALNYRHNKFNAFINADTRQMKGKSSGESVRTSNYGESINILDQTEDGSMHMGMSRLSAGFDYFIDTRNNITLSASKRDMNFGGDGNTYNQSITNGITDRIFNRFNESDRGVDSYEYNLSYKHTFPQKGREFTNDIIISDNSMNSDSYITQQETNLSSESSYVPAPLKQWNLSNNKNKMLTVQGNYIYPMENGSRIETGYKASSIDMLMNYDYRNYIPSSDSWESIEALRNKYDYNEQIYAVYGIYANSWKKFSYQGGLRFEQAYTHSIIDVGNSDFKTSYSSFYPSFHTKYDLGKKKELQLSYSRRVRRPSPRDMNPYVDYSDSLNLRTGNPELDPEYTNSIELGLNQYWDKNSLSANLFYRYTNDEVEEITTLLEEGVTITMPYNVSKETNYGLELVGSTNPAKWLRANGNVSFYRALMSEIPEYDIEGSDRFSWSARLNMSVTPWKNGSFQVNGNYNSRRRSLQSDSKARYFADLSFRQDLMKNKLSFSLRLTDVFNTRKFEGTTYGNNFTSVSTRTRESRILFFGFQYQFNNFKNKSRNNEEMNGEEMEMEGF